MPSTKLGQLERAVIIDRNRFIIADDPVTSDGQRAFSF
jgi:hypothetical protein